MQTTKSTRAAATMANEYERALARAHQAGLYIVGRGQRKSDGAPIVAVSSSRTPNQFHLVVIGRDRLWCDCPARGLCAHRALARELLVREWRRSRDQVEAIEEAALAAALRELHHTLQAREYPVRADQVLRNKTMKGAVAIPDVAEMTVRGVHDVKPITIWK